jgi:hypothetical protein
MVLRGRGGSYEEEAEDRSVALTPLPWDVVPLILRWNSSKWNQLAPKSHLYATDCMIISPRDLFGALPMVPAGGCEDLSYGLLECH